MAQAKPKRLRKLRINRVDLVDRGANPDADVLLFKRADVEKVPLTTAQINALPDSAFAVIQAGGEKDDDGKTIPRSLRKLPFKNPDGSIDLPRLRNALARLPQTDLTAAQRATAARKLRAAARDAQIGEFAKEHDMKLDLTLARTHAGDDRELRKGLDWVEDVFDGLVLAVKQQDDDDDDRPRDLTFNDVMVGRAAHKVMQRVQEFAMALDETVRRIADGKAQHRDDDKNRLLKDAIESFVRAIKADLPKFVDAEMGGMAKQDRERLEDVAKLIRGGEPTMTDNKKDNKKPVADMGALRKMFGGFARLMGATEADVSTFDPPSGNEDVWKGVSPQLRERIEQTEQASVKAQADEVTKREAAEARVAKLEEERTLAAVTAELQSYKNIGIDPTKDAGLFSKIVGGLSKEEANRVREIFKGADETIEAGKVFAELGAASLGVPDGSADEEVEKCVNALMAKAENKDMTRDDAEAQVFRADPALYERYRRENTVRV